MKIEFKPIPGFNGYFISKDGLVLSKKRLKGHCISFVRQYLHTTGCWGIDLIKNNKRQKCKVHRLVAMTYLKNKNNLPQVNHLNGDRLDNRLSNLEWCTMSQNNLHATQVLNRPRGFHASKKMIKARPLIKKMLKKGIKQLVIAKKFDISASVVSRIKSDPRKKYYYSTKREYL